MAPDAWVPLMMQPQMRPGTDLTSRGVSGLEMIVRLNEGVALAQAQTTMNVLAHQLADAYPETNRGLGVDPDRRRYAGGAPWWAQG